MKKELTGSVGQIRFIFSSIPSQSSKHLGHNHCSIIADNCGRADQDSETHGFPDEAAHCFTFEAVTQTAKLLLSAKGNLIFANFKSRRSDGFFIKAIFIHTFLGHLDKFLVRDLIVAIHHNLVLVYQFITVECINSFLGHLIRSSSFLFQPQLDQAADGSPNTISRFSTRLEAKLHRKLLNPTIPHRHARRRQSAGLVPALTATERLADGGNGRRVQAPADGERCQGKRCHVMARPIVAVDPEPFGVSAQ
jgi:hypothetical protein